MIRRAAAVILALTIHPALLGAQDTALTVTVPSADVYKAPSNVTPVIGHVSRGTVLPIARNLGSWVKIAWPGAEDGAGHLADRGVSGKPDGQYQAKGCNDFPDRLAERSPFMCAGLNEG
jgi:hypothetical protein